MDYLPRARSSPVRIFLRLRLQPVFNDQQLHTNELYVIIYLYFYFDRSQLLKLATANYGKYYLLVFEFFTLFNNNSFYSSCLLDPYLIVTISL